MKKIYSLLVMMLVGFAATWAETSTLTFESKCNGSGTADDGVAWTVTSDGTESTYDSTKGIHYGTGSAAVQYIKLSTSGITGTITEVKVNASTASGVSATASVTVGGAAFGGDAQSLSTTATDYTFTGSASGEIVVTVTKPSSATKAIYVKSVAVTYTEGGEPAQTYAITYNEMENGSVTGPAEAAEGATVTLTIEPDNGYQLASLTVEDENDVAISVSNNKFTMPAGPVYVSATFEEIPPLTSLATVNAYADGTEFTFTAPTVVLGKKNRNMYIVTADNAAGTLLYASSNWADDYTFGKEIAAGWSGTKTTYNTKPEVTNPTGMSLSGNEVTLTPIEISAADLTLANFGRYAVLRSAVSDGSAITDANNVAVTTYNQFDYAVPAAGTYDIYGVIGWNNGAGQFMILDTEAVDVPEPTKYAIEIDGQIVNGSIEADKAEAAEGETVTLTVTPATGYELEAITVLDANLEEVTVSNNAFTMPASNVLVSATFVEQGEQPQPGGTTVTDELTYDLIGVTGSSYTSWTDKEGTSGTIYAGNTAGGNNAIQLRSNNSNSGIVNTSSVGNVKSVTLTWNTNTSATRTVSIYGSNTAYTAASELYNSSKQGTLLGEFNIDDATNRVSKLTVDGDYAYVGIRSKSGALYLDGIDIEWATSSEPVTEEFYITASPAAGTYEGPQTVFLEGHNGDIFAATYNIDGGQEQDYDAQTGVTIDSSCTINFTALDGDANEATLEAAYVITYPELEVTLTPEAGTYYEAQNVKVAVANVYNDGEYLVSYKIGEGAEQEYDAEAGIDITESCTLTISVEATYQSFEQSYEYVITEAPSPLEGYGFVKLQSSAELISGQYLIVYEADEATGYALNSSLDEIDAASNYVEVAIANGIIEATDANKAIALTFDAEVGSFQAANGLYIGHSGSKNTLNTFDSATALNVSINADASAEIAQPNSTYHLRFNASAGQERFRFFTTEQKPIALYILREEPVATTDMAEVTEAGEYVVTVGNVVAFDDDANMVYTTDGQDNWLPILIEDADLYAQAKAAATLSQIAGSFDASATAPLFTATAFNAEGEFVENSQEIYTFDLADESQELNPKAGQVIKIKGIWYGGELRAYSGANGGNRGRSFTVLGATDALVEGTAYSIPVAVTLKEAWDEEASTGAPKRVAKDGDAAFQNLQGKIVGGADMIEGVSTAVTDLNSDKTISGVQYVNVAGQVSAEPFDGVNIVVTTYVDGTRSAVKVVR